MTSRTEPRDPYVEMDAAIALIAEATWGAGQDPDESMHVLSAWTKERFRHHYGRTRDTVARVAERYPDAMDEEAQQ